MKKDSLLKMKDLPATEEMLAVAREDVPVKVGSGWNTSYRCRYSGFARSSVEGGILKVTLYDPDAMRLGGTLPVYEIFMEKEKQQFLTYDRAHDKWRAAKIDYLEWQAKESNNVWISAVDDAQIRQYLASDEKNVYRAILKFQRAVRDAELERRHRKETDPWDAELSQTPPLPKDWERWVNNERFGAGVTLNPLNLIDSGRFEVKTANATIFVAPEQSYLLETRVIDGRKYLTIPVEEEIEVNGFGVRTRGEKQG